MPPPAIKSNSGVRRPLTRTLSALYHRRRNYETIPTAFLEDSDAKSRYTRAGWDRRQRQDIPPEQEGFFNLLSHVQGARIDEQRCNIQIVHNKGGSTGLEEHSPDSPPPEMNKLMDMLAHSQSRRLDDQRADFTYVPGCPNTENNGTATSKK
ncbi:Purkinje cell protein 2 homolog isoform X3 [Pleurodeles waltl]|uniref:Purkinje cell protein 2 homolog isoform X3 n=1 Tax=Pleurodeles waltl TaxID=8319 RepID=UPI0037097B97